MEAQEKGTLVAFSRMSPSMVYLKDQAEVSLAFAQVSHAVDFMIRDKGLPVFRKFFDSLKREPFAKAFQASYKRTPAELPGLLAGWKEQDYELVATETIYKNLDRAHLPYFAAQNAGLPGRSGTLLLQGKPFLPATLADIAEAA